MLNTTNSNSEYLHNYIRKVAKQEQETVDTSSVYTGTIEAAQSGIYTIVLNQSDNSSSVLAIPIVSGDVYDKDDSVYLLRANTTATVNYFIVGKVNAIQEAFFNLTELERFNPNESKVDLSFGSNDFISISEDANNIFNSINALGYFQLEVKITSKVEDGAKIIIYLNYTDKSHYGAKFVFSSYEFIGQPGGNNYTLVQKKIFHLPSNINIKSIKNIRIEKIGDFSVAAMNIVAGSLLEVSAAYQNDIVVQNDRNYFEKEIPNVSNPLNIITLTSKIYYNNKPLAGDALQYYWLLKDDSAVNPESRDYVNIEGAGNGWRCLNTLTLATTADGEEIRLWDNKNNFITLNKKNFIVPNDPNEFVNFSNFVNKVKCIVKYFDNFIESDLIDIYNYDYEQFSAILQSTVDNNILAYKDDKIILQCEVLNDNEKIDNSKYSIEYRWYIKSRNADESDLNITAKNEKNEDILTYSSLTIYDSAYTNTLQKGEYKLAKGKTEEEFYCVATIIPKGIKEGYHSEQTNVVKVSSNAAAADITQSTEYKYYISNEHNITFSQRIKQEEGQLSEWNGDWVINITGAIWVGPVGVDYNTVFSSFDIFKLAGDDEEQFVYYTQRNVWRERGEVFKTENWSFPQIARSVINVNGWKNHRVGDNVNQLNTFNQLSDNGKEDGIYYADIAKITTDDTPDWGTKYYERNVSPDGEISYTLISLEANIHFKKDQDYYIYNSEKEQYELVLSNTDYDKSTEYYEKINDNEYQKLIINTQNFDITNVAWPSNKAGPFYTNIDNKLLINASYIRSGTLEVKDKFYASIDQDDVRIAGYSADENILQSQDGSTGISSNGKQIKINNGKEEENLDLVIWAGASNESYPFAVTKEGRVYAKDISIGSGLIDANTFITNVNGTLDSLQQQIDGEITSWFEAGTPIDINESGSNKIEVNENPPSDQWDTPEEKIKHEGDLYYDTNTQYCFRWIRKGIEPNYTWEWTQIADEGISEAMAAAAAAQTTAEGKSTVHYGTQDPTEIVGVTVNIGDLWVPGTSSDGSNVIKVYRGSSYGWVRAEDSQTKQETEAIVSEAITNSENKISQEYQQAIQDALDGLENSLYFETVRLSQENSNVKIPAIILKAKDIDDNNNEIGLIYFNTESLVINSSNLKLNCYYGDDGLSYYQKGHLEIDTAPFKLINNTLTIDTTNFKFNTEGTGNLKITGELNATGGFIGGFHINTDHLSSGVEPADSNWHDVMLSSGYGTGDDKSFCFWAGDIPNGKNADLDRPFWVKNDGTFKASVGSIGDFNLFQKKAFYYSSTPSSKTTTKNITLEYTGNEPGTEIGTHKYIYPIYKKISYDTIFPNSPNFLILSATCSSKNSPGSDLYPQVWISEHNNINRTITINALNTNKFQDISTTLTIEYMEFPQVMIQSVNANVFQLKDKGFTIMSTVDQNNLSTKSLSNISKIIGDELHSAFLISSNCRLGNLSFQESMIKGKDARQFIKFDNYVASINMIATMAKMANIFVITITDSSMGQTTIDDLTFLIRYKKKGFNSYEYNTITIAKGETSGYLVVNDLLEIDDQDYGFLYNGIFNKSVDNFKYDDVTSYYAGNSILFSTDALVPNNTSYILSTGDPSGAYASIRAGETLGTFRYRWWNIYTNYLSAINLQSGRHTIAKNNSDNSGWNYVNIQFPIKFSDTPAVVVSGQPTNKISKAAINGPLVYNVTTESFDVIYATDNDGDFIINWIAFYNPKI